MMVHSTFYILQAILIVIACRWIARTSQKIFLLVVAGVAIRLVSGLGLLAVSYFDVSLLRGYHTGDGFWLLAPDARVYYRLASQAASNGVFSVSGGSPSPLFVAALGAWFSALGTSLVAAIAFNVTCYVLTCLAVVAAGLTGSPGRRASDALVSASALVVGCITFSPLLVLSSTQPLKDPFFAMLIVMACVGALKTLTWLTYPPEGRNTALLSGAVIVLAAVWGIAGTRAYYGVLVWLAYASAVVVALITVAARRRLSAAAVGIVVLALMWATFRIGAGAYYDAYRGMAATAVSRSVKVMTGVPPSDDDFAGLGGTIITFRRGFVASAGATNLGSSGVMSTPVAIARGTAVGVAATLLPISMLQAFSIVDIRGGGRGLMWFTDVDTIFLEATLVAALWLFMRNRRGVRQSAAAVAFIVVLSVTTGLLAAYIVTNFGTLFRLRLLAIVPAALLPLTLRDPAPSVELNLEQPKGSWLAEKTLWLKRLA